MLDVLLSTDLRDTVWRPTGLLEASGLSGPVTGPGRASFHDSQTRGKSAILSPHTAAKPTGHGSLSGLFAATGRGPGGFVAEPHLMAPVRRDITDTGRCRGELRR